MKKITFSFVLLLLTLGTYCQVYYPFPDSNAIWNNVSHWSPYVFIERYGILGDTIINNKTYNKLYLIENDSTLNLNAMNYYASLRENDSKQIFVKLDEYEDEVLIYDFSLKVGDTIKSNAPTGYLNWFPCVITSIDTIELENNQFRRRFKINNWGNYEYWIEGVGSIGGLLYPISDYLSGTISNLLCFKHNDIAVYLNNPECDKCFCSLATSIEETNKKNDFITIYPNPAKETVNFEFGNLQNPQNLQQAQLRCYDVFGSLLHSEAIVKGQKEVVLDISSWPSGMYVAVVYNNGGVVGRSKFVVE